VKRHGVKHKRCSSCKTLRPTYRFDKNKGRPDGLSHECRQCRAERRERGRLDRRPKEPKGSIFYVKVPAERLLPYFKEHLGKQEGQVRTTYGSLARAVHRLENELTEASFDFADRWFVEMGLCHLWHVAPEHGGFSDLYELRPSRSLRAQPPTRHAAAEPWRASAGGGTTSPPSGPSRSSSRGAASSSRKKATA
jgi:hypothetical protein